MKILLVGISFFALMLSSFGFFKSMSNLKDNGRGIFWGFLISLNLYGLLLNIDQMN